MGIFSKVKNFVTGGSAIISVEVIQPTLTGPFIVRVEATAKADISVRKVWLEVRGQEEIDARVRVSGNTASGGSTSGLQHVKHHSTTEERQYQIGGPIELTTDQSHHWEYEVELPANAQPTYRGASATHQWQIRAGLDVSGNDPDSGWIDFDPAISS